MSVEDLRHLLRFAGKTDVAAFNSDAATLLDLGLVERLPSDDEHDTHPDAVCCFRLTAKGAAVVEAAHVASVAAMAMHGSRVVQGAEFAITIPGGGT